MSNDDIIWFVTGNGMRGQLVGKASRFMVVGKYPREHLENLCHGNREKWHRRPKNLKSIQKMRQTTNQLGYY